MATNKEIPIVFSVDDHYAPCLEVCIASILDHVNAQDQYRILILNQHLTTTHQRELLKMARPKVSIELVSIDQTLVNRLDHVQGKLRDDFFTLTIFFRLFIADLFPDLDRAIYLDADTVVLDDLANLYDTELGDNLIAGVPDAFALQNENTVRYVTHMVGVTPGHYLNSGVLVMNLAQFREDHISQIFLHLENTYHINALAPDQDYLNAISQGRSKVIDASWNTMPGGTGSESPKLIHFFMFNKPWQYDRVPLQKYFWHYARQTNYFVVFQQSREAYSNTQKMLDQAHAQALIKMAGRLAKSPRTLRTVLGLQGIR